MMANWNKLNKEYFDLMNSFEDSDWEKWESIRSTRKEMRRLEMLLKAKIQEEKLKLTELLPRSVGTINQIVITTLTEELMSSIKNPSVSSCGESNYALAA